VNPTSKYRAELRLVIRALTAAALSLLMLRMPVTGEVGRVFQAARIARPPTIREAPERPRRPIDHNQSARALIDPTTLASAKRDANSCAQMRNYLILNGFAVDGVQVGCGKHTGSSSLERSAIGAPDSTIIIGTNMLTAGS
jgi:hypothetical protein